MPEPDPVRVAFEKWVESDAGGGRYVGRREDLGPYMWPTVEADWRVWRAGAAAERRACAKVAKGKDNGYCYCADRIHDAILARKQKGPHA